MARTPVSPAQRAENVRVAIVDVPGLFLAAQKASADYGPTDARTLRAWEAVEVHGATIHRQARLLAGKSKGG